MAVSRATTRQLFSRRVRAALVVLLFGFAGPVAGVELSGRAKLFAQSQWLRERDVTRAVTAAPAIDADADLRLSVTQSAGRFTFSGDLEITALTGDAQALRSKRGQGIGNDGSRWRDLSLVPVDRRRHAVRGRLDRAFVRYRMGSFSLTAGREATSLGNGLVFQPMDLFTPFSPTETDRDFKTGDDLIMAQKLFANGSDVQVLVVGHRDARGRRSGADTSFGGRWHGFIGPAETEVLIARHFRDRVVGLGASIPLGPALARTDVVVTRADGAWFTSAIVNADYSFMFRGRNVYVFGEYYRNGFGMTQLPHVLGPLDEVLAARLARGEVFTLARNYLAFGSTIEWHPLWNQGLLLISSMEDGSAQFQTTLTYTPDDDRSVEFALTSGIGTRGDEFAGLRLPDGTTIGGSATLHVRYLRYF